MPPLKKKTQEICIFILIGDVSHRDALRTIAMMILSLDLHYFLGRSRFQIFFQKISWLSLTFSVKLIVQSFDIILYCMYLQNPSTDHHSTQLVLIFFVKFNIGQYFSCLNGESAWVIQSYEPSWAFPKQVCLPHQENCQWRATFLPE